MRRFAYAFGLALLVAAVLVLNGQLPAAQVKAFSATGIAGPNTKVAGNTVTGPVSGTASAPYGKFTGSYVAKLSGNNTSATVKMNFAKGSITVDFQATYDNKLNLNVGPYVITAGASGSGTLSYRGNADGTATFWMSGTISP